MNCPNCGSGNVQFRRENQGEIRGKGSKRIIHKTVGFCKDCGATWNADGSSNAPKRKTWLWVLGWLFIFPLPLTILLLRKKDMVPALKYSIIAVAWIIYLLIGIGSSMSSKENAAPEAKKITVTLEVEPRVNSDDGSVLFAIKTNLPEDTKLMVTVTNDDGYKGQDHATILKNGEGYTAEFSDKGEALKGTYKVCVTMGLASIQKETVQAVIGSKGENIDGPFVITDGGENMVEGEFEFTFD